MEILSSMDEAAQPLLPARVHRRIVVDAPDIVAATDLADRLRAHTPLVSSNGGDGCRLTVPRADPDASRGILATVQEWARHWELEAVPVKIDRRPYTLGSPPEAETDRRPRPKLLFFYSAHSGQCRRAEALLAQVLQRRHNHD